MHLRRAAALLGLILPLQAFAPAQAHAGLTPAVHVVTRTAAGDRCTIVGTPDTDVLRGTAHRDVICGLGGRDRIIGGGGDDVLDGGPGSDVIQGGPGNDELAGDAGADRLSGQAGSDTLDGDGGSDALIGQAGDDDLTGGSGTDTLTGGAGTNWCTVDSADVETRCVYDRAAPQADGADLDVGSVTVASESAQVEVRVHLTDDTGVTQVFPTLVRSDGSQRIRGTAGTLTRGTARDGWWTAQVFVPRFALGGTYHVQALDMRDRAGRWAIDESDLAGATLQIVDAHPDLVAPKVTSLISPTATQVVDVRTAGQQVTFSARVTDDASGVSAVSFCPLEPFSGGFTNLACGDARRVSGTEANGVWSTTITVPRGAPGGTWDVEVDVFDHVGHAAYWQGPDNAAATPDANYPTLPAGQGRFTVRGAARDTHPPTLDSADLGATTLRTLAQAASVTISVHARDLEGVTEVAANLNQLGDSTAIATELIDLRLVSGTARDGIWSGRLTLPQGAPPDDYYLAVYLQDSSHWVGWAARELTVSWPDVTPLPGDDHVTVLAQ